MISKILTASLILLSHLLRIVSWIIPRDRKLWVFVGWHHNGQREVFADNSKYLFLYVSQLTTVRAIWIAQDRDLAKMIRHQGYNAHALNSAFGLYYSLRAGITIIDAYFRRENWRLAGGSRIVQLWHGKGFKKIGHNSSSSLKKHNRLIAPELFTTHHDIIASSPYTAQMMAQSFAVPIEQILITGLPRNDILFHEMPGSELDAHPELKRIFQSDHQPQGGYILYAPTFRRSGESPVDHLDLNLFDKYLETEDACLIISLHPKYRGRAIPTNHGKRIFFIDAGYDIYPFLKNFKALITDYSSLFIEFALLNKHAVFFTYDLKAYRETTGLYEDFEILLPGPQVNSSAEILDALNQAGEWEKQRNLVREKLFTYVDGRASERIATYLLSGEVSSPGL